MMSVFSFAFQWKTEKQDNYYLQIADRAIIWEMFSDLKNENQSYITSWDVTAILRLRISPAKVHYF